MKKKTIILMTISFALVALLMLFLNFVKVAIYNLSDYAIYYAKHTPHKEGIEPTLIMLMEKLEKLGDPRTDLFVYDFDGSKMLKDRKTGNLLYRNGTGLYYSRSDGKVLVLEADLGENIYDQKEIIASNLKHADIIAEIYDLFQPILDLQPEPDWNLQWLFDRIYHRRFNQGGRL